MRAAEAMETIHYDVHPDHPLKEAVARMRQDGVDVLPVIDGDEVVGLLTIADAKGETTAWDVDTDRAAVRDVMSASFAWGYADDPLEAVSAALERSGQRRLPLVNRQHELVGMLAADGGAGQAKPAAPASGAAEQVASTGGRAGGDAGLTSYVASGYRTRPRIRPQD
ncbi:MAG: CBS domain-containing protein [Alphaproteobacteria bacterium]